MGGSNSSESKSRVGDEPGASSNAQRCQSVAAGVVVSGSGATATFNNPNQSIAGLNPKPGAATPTSSNVTGGIVATNRGQVTIHHNYPQPGQQSAMDENAGSRQLPARNTSSTAIGVCNKETKMLRAINKVMWNKVNSNIEVVKAKSDVSLDPQVYPQFSESDFYKDFPEHPEDGERHEYVIDDRFQMRKKRKEQTSHIRLCTFKSVMKEFCQPVDQQNHERLAVFGLFAQAGAGKTTCMRHWAKHAMIDSKCSPGHEFYTPHETNRFSLVLYYDLKSCMFNDRTTLKDFLFEGVVKESEKDFAYDWVLENQSKVIIFFDGLDQATWTITEEHDIDIGPHGHADTPTIMCNLLSRSSLPQSRIILSSREFKAATLPQSARPEKIFIMQGFSPNDAELVFNSLVFEKFHENPWQELSKTSASLKHFLSIPMFLAFSVLVYRHSKGFLPNSVTLLLAKVLALLQRSNNIQEREGIWPILKKLKSLAHYGMENQVVVFREKDLTNHELKVDEVRDLLFMVPSNNTMNQVLMEGDFLLFFCHQCVQEFLSACFIVELPLSGFKEFVKDYLNEREWTVVRRFVCGLIFVKEINERLVQISNKDKKQDILRQSLAEQLKRRHGLELYAAIHESNDGSVIHSITKIQIVHQPLSSDGAHLIGSLMARCKKKNEKLDSLNIYRCDLNNNFLPIMAKSMGDPKIQVLISKIHLREYSCCFDFAALNNFLEHIDSDMVIIESTVGYLPRDVKEDGQRCEFDWRNIRQICFSQLRTSWFMSRNLNFRNMDDSIMLTLEKEENSSNYFGSYNKKDKMLKVEPEKSNSLLMQHTAVAVHWLNRCSVSLNIEDKLSAQFLHYEYLIVLVDMDITGNRQIENILLDFRGSSNFLKYGRDITSIGKKFQVKVIDLAISFWSVGHQIGKLEPHLPLHDFELKIHVVLRNHSKDYVEYENIKKQFAILKRSNVQIESFRLFYYSDDISFDNLAPWIQNLSEAGVKQCFIIHEDSRGTITDREKLEWEAHSRGIELTFVHPRCIDRNNPWKHIYRD